MAVGLTLDLGGSSIPRGLAQEITNGFLNPGSYPHGSYATAGTKGKKDSRLTIRSHEETPGQCPPSRSRVLSASLLPLCGAETRVRDGGVLHGPLDIVPWAGESFSGAFKAPHICDFGGQLIIRIKFRRQIHKCERKTGPGGTPRMEIPSGTTSSTINRGRTRLCDLMSPPKVKDEFSFTRLIVEDMLFHWNLLQGCTHQSL